MDTGNCPYILLLTLDYVREGVVSYQGYLLIIPTRTIDSAFVCGRSGKFNTSEYVVFYLVCVYLWTR